MGVKEDFVIFKNNVKFSVADKQTRKRIWGITFFLVAKSEKCFTLIVLKGLEQMSFKSYRNAGRVGVEASRLMGKTTKNRTFNVGVLFLPQCPFHFLLLAQC